MNLKTTLVLTLLVAAGVLSWLFLLPRPGKRASDTLTLLEEQLTPAKLTSIEIKHGDRKVELSREGGEWSLPGKWPVRKAEVEALVGTLTSLRSRFEPIALGTPPDLARYGLDRDPLVVKVKTGGKEHKLTFGEKADETNHFSQATYLRLGESSEVVRLAPNLIGILERPQDYYRQRRLFPAERVAKESGSQEKVDLLLAKKVEVTSGATGYAVEKSDDGWRVRDLARDDAGQFKPGHIQDRADPETLKRIQAAVPDIWVERFVAAREKKEFGLDKPEQTVTVARPSGDTLTLLVGNISRKGPAKIQKSPFDPQMKIPPKVTFEEFRYARLKDNDQVFEVRTDRLKDLPTSVADLRDPQLARFAATDARRVEIDEDGRRLVFVHDKDKDRWRMEKPSAVDVEDAKVSELLNRLSGLEARGADIIDKADPKMSGLDKPASVKITLEEKKEGEKDKKTREVTFLLGKQAEKDRLYVQVAGTARINQVEDEVLKLVKRPALAYRSRRLLDVPTRDLVEIKVKRDAETLTLTQEKSDWKLTAPVQAEADAGKAAQLAGEVARLEAVEFIADNVSPEDLDKLYGLAKPAATVTVNFKDKEKAGRTLTLGKQRPGKQEFFARLDGDPTVFAVKKETHDILERDSLAYRPLNLWRLPPDGIAEVRILKTEPEYRLSREGGDWKVSGPFDAKVQAEQVRSMAKELADPDAERYVAHATKEPEKYGLDKPYLRVTVREALPKDAKEGKEHVLMIGGKADKGGRYAQRGGADGVFVLPEKLVAVIDRDALDLLDRKLLALDENKIERIHTKTAGQSFTVEKQKDGAWRVIHGPQAAFVPDPRALNDSLDVWAALRALRFAAYGKVDAAAFGLDKPAVIVQVTVQEGDAKDKPGKTSEHTLALGKPVAGGKGERYAQLDKGPGVVILDAETVKDLDRTHLDFVSRSVLTFDADKLTALKRTVGADVLEVVKKDGNWRIVKPADAPADPKTLDLLGRQLADLRAVRVAAYPARDLGPFGLDKPAAVLTVSVLDDKGKPVEHVIHIGAPAADKGDRKEDGLRYARVNGKDSIVVLRTRLAVDLLAPALQFRDRNLVRVDAPDRVVVEQGKRKLTFTRVDDAWKLTGPVEADAESAELEAFVKELTRLRADELVAPRAVDPKLYGLDRPRAQWRLFAGDKELLTLLVGGTPTEPDTKESRRAYARVSAAEMVFLLNPRQTEKALAEYRSRKPWPPIDAVQIDRVTYGYAKDAFTLQKVDGDWEVAGRPGVKVNTDAVRDVLEAVASLQAERYVADRGGETKLSGLEPPWLKLEVQTPTAKRTLHIGLQEGGSARRYAGVPGQQGTVFVISEAAARRIVRSLQDFTGKR